MAKFYEKLQASSPVSAVILSIGIILMAGFLMTRLTKLLKLPNVTAYIVAGILIGPFCLKAVPQNVIDGSAFVSDIALAFIAFSAGEFFRFSSLKARANNSRSSPCLRRWRLRLPCSCFYILFCGSVWCFRWCCRLWHLQPRPRLL